MQQKGSNALLTTLLSGVYWIVLIVMFVARHVVLDRSIAFDLVMILVGSIAAVHGAPFGRNRAGERDPELSVAIFGCVLANFMPSGVAAIAIAGIALVWVLCTYGMLRRRPASRRLAVYVALALFDAVAIISLLLA